MNRTAVITAGLSFMLVAFVSALVIPQFSSYRARSSLTEAPAPSANESAPPAPENALVVADSEETKSSDDLSRNMNAPKTEAPATLAQEKAPVMAELKETQSSGTISKKMHAPTEGGERSNAARRRRGRFTGAPRPASPRVRRPGPVRVL